jgi:hypothetical protein
LAELAGDYSCTVRNFSEILPLQLCSLMRTRGEFAMATQVVMDHSGDTRYDFDANSPQALQEAEERFRQLTGVGFTAATRNSSGEPVVTGRFDPAAEETLFFPRLVGG